MTITGRQIREARALLGWERNKLAAKAGTVSTLTIMRAEKVDREPPITPAQAAAIRRALERAGVEIGPYGEGAERASTMTHPGLPEASILPLLKRRGATSALAIGAACNMMPGEVRRYLATLENLQLVAGCFDTSTPPRRVYDLTAEGAREAAP